MLSEWRKGSELLLLCSVFIAGSQSLAAPLPVAVAKGCGSVADVPYVKALFPIDPALKAFFSLTSDRVVIVPLPINRATIGEARAEGDAVGFGIASDFDYTPAGAKIFTPGNPPSGHLEKSTRHLIAP